VEGGCGLGERGKSGGEGEGQDESAFHAASFLGFRSGEMA
jgi:hypothetical protein